MNDADFTRRKLFAGGGLAAAALVGLATTAEAAEPAPQTPAEAANVKVVQDFIATWGAAEFDPDKVMPAFLTSDANVRAVDGPFTVGPAAVAAAFKPYIQHGERFPVKYLSVFARGPLVITHRIDTVVTPGKPDLKMEVVGVFLLANGKIKEWIDYIVG
jgi:limonene-1,2-epoxide hydrolase